MSSTRLPDKVLLEIEGKPMLYYVIKQVRASKIIKEVVIATTTEREDDVIVEYCKKVGVKCFRGSKKDLLDRYYQCAKKFRCDPIVRITSDCPLIDPTLIDKIIKKFLRNSYDYIANNLEKMRGRWDNSTCNFPQGMTVEISSFRALEKAWKEAKKISEREHVFPYVQFNPKLFKVSNLKNKVDLSFIRCTVDRTEDLIFVREVYKRVPKGKKFVSIKDILKIVTKERRLVKINNNIPFDDGYRKSLEDDSTAEY